MNLKKQKIYCGVLSMIVAISIVVPMSVKATTLSADQLYAQAYSETKTALTVKTQKSINNARIAIDALKGTGASWAIGQFSYQIDQIQQPILSNIINAIETAKYFPTQFYVNRAKAIIDSDLPSDWKNSYSSAIDDVEKGIIKQAVVDYTRINQSNNQTYTDIALSDLEEIKTSTDSSVALWADTIEKQLGISPVEITLTNGNKYVGELKNSVPDGYGTETSSKGWKYSGQFKNGLANGQGIFSSPDGSIYIGEVKDDKFNGQGFITYSNGEKYSGEWKDDLKNGYGAYSDLEGNSYEGQWEEDNINGQGTFYNANGYKFEGQWKDNKMNGQGTLTSDDGMRIVGQWKDGNLDGLGTVTLPNGTVEQVQWKDGKYEVVQ